MEEASVAGESPDRSKQRESSAEPTSGSAGPVPGKRDPRLSVARDAAPSATRGTADTATRVLSAPAGSPAEGGAPAEGEGRSPAGGDDDSRAEGGRGTSAEGDGGSPARAAGGSPVEGDGRLREAVAAWVRSAEPSEDLKGDAARDTADTAAAAPEETGAASDDADTAGGSASGDADTAASDAGAGTSTAADGPSEDAGTDPAEDSTPEDAGTDPASVGASGNTPTDTSSAPEDARPAGGSASRGSSEAPAADGGGEDPRADEADGGASEDAGTPAAEGGSREGTGADLPEGSDSREAGAGAAADAVSEDRAADSAGAGRASGEAGAGAAADAVSEDGGTKRSEDRAEENADAGEDGGSEGPGDRADDGADAVAGGGRAGGAGGVVPAARSASADGEAESRERGDADGGRDEAGGDGGVGKGDKGGKGGKRAVDQPTAVFRTRKPAVDQPTTMLKLGDAGTEPEKEPGTEPEPGAKPEAEREAERTSKFVALKDFDDPAVRKPPPAADATTALRTVAPAEATTSLPQVGPERTTQQPLPPKPPLDLLAELTNTPPPPQTPLRTAVRRVKIWTPLVLLLVIVFAVVQNFRPLPAPTLELTAEESYTFDGGKPEIPWPAAGQAALDVQGIGTFGSSGEQKPVPIASVAKVMTAYLILRDHPLKSGAEGPMLKIDELAEQQSDAGQESTVKVTAGDEISQREAVESVLIASANNVARLLARWDAGSEKAFVEKMNEAAEDLGMTNTTYTDPSGLNDTTVSTAVDQVKLAKEAMKQPAFREVAAMMSYDDYKGVNHSNWNQLVGHNNVVGIKTGTTTSALGNLVFAAKKEVDGETRTVVGAVVRQPAGGKDNTILSAALTAGDDLIRAAQGALESATILKKGTVVGYVDDGLGGRTPVAVTEDVKAVGWAGLSVKLTFAADELPRTAEAGTKVGTLTVGDGTSSAVKVPVALQEDLVEPAFADRLTRLT
ncbi:D-alanyl-D-alanine carboxypeptidase [Streptomyces pilosus]|uniref:D-alanyl-D-alanine carboxypeptidase n=1 Tax=Streptomyces pilosus TaxID=28893 RepID=UPI00362B421A